LVQAGSLDAEGRHYPHELGDLMQEELLKRGYSPVFTPHIGHVELYKISGHFPYYKDSQYPTIKGEGDEEYLLKR